MKKSTAPRTISAVLSAVLGGVLLAGTASAQQPAASAGPLAHKVGLIDMGEVFKNYERFKVERENLKLEIKQADDKMKGMVTQLQQTGEQLKKLKPGSEQYATVERQAAQLSSELETYRKVRQLEFARKEAAIYKEIYLEVTTMVEAYAKHQKYTLILRFDRTPLDSGEIKPQEIVKRMQREVLYFDGQYDLTDKILGYLNKRYTASRTPAATRN